MSNEVATRIADALIQAELHDRLYGLVLAYSLGGLYGYVWPLYEFTRALLLEAGEDPYALWDPSWPGPEQLPSGVPEELPDRNIEVALYEDPALRAAYERYRGEPRDSEEALERVARLWRGVASRLTELSWGPGVDVTQDFVALAYPNEWLDADIVHALESSLGPRRFAEFATRGLIPKAG